MATDIVNYTETMNNNVENEYLAKLLGIWEDADEEYIYYQEAKKLWKELNMEKAAVA